MGDHNGVVDPLDPTILSRNLREDGEGFWISRVREKVSYPTLGHDLFFEIEENSFWFKHRNDCLREVLRRYPPGGILVDLGGGNGYVSNAMIESGYPTVLIEPGESGARHAWERGIRPVVCASLEEVGFPDASLSSVGMFDVLEHIEDDVHFLHRLRNFMKPGGRLYLTIPAHPILWSNEDVKAGHYRRYTRDSINRVLREAGFMTVYDTHLFSFLWLPVLVWRMLSTRLGFGNKDLTTSERKDHAVPKGWKRHLLRYLEARELRLIASGRVSYGTSLMIVAQPLVQCANDGAA